MLCSRSIVEMLSWSFPVQLIVEFIASRSHACPCALLQLQIERMTKDILECYFKAQPLPEKDIIVSGGRLAEAYS